MYACSLLLHYADPITVEDFSNRNNSFLFQRASTLASTYFQGQNGDSSSSVSGLSSGAIAGIVISIIVVVLLLVAIIVAMVGFVARSQRSKK